MTGYPQETLTGALKVKPKQTSRQQGKITDWEKFRAFVKEHGDKTQTEMAQLWEGEISQGTISGALQQIGFTRKKKYGYEQRSGSQTGDIPSATGESESSSPGLRG